MTAKKTAAKPAANPFEEEDKPKGQTLPKTVEDEKGSSLPVDDSKKASEPSSEPKTEAAAPVGNPDKDPTPKTTRKRRTKAQIEADNKAKDGESSGDLDFNQVDFEKYPLSAVSNQVVGSISVNAGAVPVISIAGMNWIGEAPIFFAASQIGDIEKVIADLKKQVRKTVREG